MICVYMSKSTLFFRVVKGAHSYKQFWEIAADMRCYPDTDTALASETDSRVREALRDIQLDEQIAYRRRRMAENLQRD